jgi:hypothetical protein
MRLILSKRNQFEVAGVDGEFCCACRFQAGQQVYPVQDEIKEAGLRPVLPQTRAMFICRNEAPHGRASIGREIK